MQAELNLALRLTDMDTKNDVSVAIRIYKDTDPMFIWAEAVRALHRAMIDLGVIEKPRGQA